ncbi:alpha/beta hydrolase [Brevundimonas sp.]|uniref:alpha/beta fold hydrolase n=1 Tax=Brevundimonas sp. TaxID=1871086 RepID=UPI002C41F36A|nr:alpha/beta hydrolase [Brevundimonas sp.]HWQ85445.1 alpha/beta hydrolase [Brevundimonas sp.]
MLVLAIAAQLLFDVADQPDRAGLDSRLGESHLTDVGDGRRLNFFCIGEGAPTVLFEQGGEGNIANWKLVQPAISALTRTCFYDRAGFGYSDPPLEPVTALNVTDDLRALLSAEHIEGPVIIVGHSVGGFYATVYASRFPEDVAGLVLVDPGFSGQQKWQTPDDLEIGVPNMMRGEDNLLSCARAARSGELTRENLRDRGCFPVAEDLPAGEKAYLLHAVTGPAWYEAEHSQSVNFFSRDDALSLSQAQGDAVRRSFGDMPLEVLSAENPPFTSRSADRNQVAGEHWRNGHRQLAERSSRGHWRIVGGAGHFVQLDQPDAVIEAIRTVIVETRRSALR